jgi:hypothetical protein
MLNAMRETPYTMSEKGHFRRNTRFQPVDKVLVLCWVKGIVRGF